MKPLCVIHKKLCIFYENNNILRKFIECWEFHVIDSKYWFFFLKKQKLSLYNDNRFYALNIKTLFFFLKKKQKLRNWNLFVYYMQKLCNLFSKQQTNKIKANLFCVVCNFLKTTNKIQELKPFLCFIYQTL